MTRLSVFLALTLAACTGRGDTDEIIVFCGAANKPAMEVIAASFEQETGIPVRMVLGGSGTLLSQMELSEQGEIYLPGSPDYILIGERKGLLIPDSDRIVAYLVPAIITPAGNPAGIHELQDLARPEVKLGIGNPRTVCLGLYGVELLEHNHLLDAVLPNVATFGASCSSTANLAAMAQVDAILGWRVFHYWNPSTMDLVLMDPEQIPRISTIPVSIPVHTRDMALSQRFIDYMASKESQQVYQQFGYIIDRGEALAFAPGATIGGEYTLPTDFSDHLATAAGLP